jgi:hypothetical protein
MIDTHERLKAANQERLGTDGGPPDDVGISATGGDSP